MKGFALLVLGGVAAFALWKHHLHSTSNKTPIADIPSGVSQYSTTPAPQQPQQLLASQLTNADAVSEPGLAAAFGPDENQPGDSEDAI